MRFGIACASAGNSFEGAALQAGLCKDTDADFMDCDEAWRQPTPQLSTYRRRRIVPGNEVSPRRHTGGGNRLHAAYVPFFHATSRHATALMAASLA
jgi:hypothetical protein